MRLKDLNKTSAEIKDLTKKYMIETYERYDFIAERAEGVYLYDENGQGYLDFYGGVAVNSAGNRNPKVVQAVKDQVDQIMHTFNYPYTLPQAMLSELICETLGMDKIFYQNSGTEANEAMIKMARKYGVDNYGPDRYEIITALDSFHGRTYGAMSATGQTDNAIQVGFKPMVPGFSYGKFNDVESFRNLVTDKTIAIMLEPVQGEGGVISATPEFMQGIKDLCDEKGLLLLFDEIQTGWGRTGEMMAFMHYGIKPDILTMAKAMGGGMPIGALVTNDKIAKTFGPGTHGSTYGGNPIACAAAYAQVNEIIDRDLPGQAKKIGKYFMEQLATLPDVKEVRGKGLLVAVEFNQVDASEIKRQAVSRHLLTTAIGASTIRMVPPLIITEAECDKAVEILRASIEAIQA